LAKKKASLKEIIAVEYKRCASDPIYFMRKYCMIQHPVRGKIPFHLYPFQEETLVDFKTIDIISFLNPDKLVYPL
jgi:hypothetical protein